MNIRFAVEKDISLIREYDKHISKDELESIINQKRVIVLEENKEFAGWLRYNLFWDNTPFMNMLFVLDKYRGKGFGKELVLQWEKNMKKMNYDLVMTSTMANENAQNFYRKLKYVDAGSLLLPEEPLEIIFIKNI